MRDQDRNRVAQLKADLETARLGSRDRPDRRGRGQRARAGGRLGQGRTGTFRKKAQIAPQAGLVFDILFYEGEWVPAGKPVVSLLPPANIKVRAFVPEARIGAVQPGQELRVSVDGVAEPVSRQGDLHLARRPSIRRR